jgi:G3E family GTPase
MRIIILSGFLGAGKTSLLLQLARHLADTPSDDGSFGRVVIIENEIGSVSVDGAAIGRLGIDTYELFAGCVCCTLNGELAATVRKLADEQATDWLIIEATGLAFPEKTREGIYASGATFASVRIISLVDAARFLDLEKVSPLTGGQLRDADIIVLNKIDLVNSEQEAEALRRIHSYNNRAEVIRMIATIKLSTPVLEKLTRM